MIQMAQAISSTGHCQRVTTMRQQKQRPAPGRTGTWSTVLVLVAPLLLAGGCSTRGHGDMSPSRLTGVWADASVQNLDDASPLIVVHPDGRFELRQTMGVLLGSYNRISLMAGW